MGILCSRPNREKVREDEIKTNSEKSKSEDSLSSENQDAVGHQNDIVSNETPPRNAKNFTYAELSIVTNNFDTNCLLEEVGFGQVYKGKLRSTDCGYKTI